MRCDDAENARVLASALAVLRRVELEAEAHLAAGSLPLGKQRIVEIARALLADPQILLLDEPAAELRFQEKLMLVKILRQLNAEHVTILLVEHDMELVMDAWSASSCSTAAASSRKAHRKTCRRIRP